LTSDFQYVDRGRLNHLKSTMSLATDYAPRSLEVAHVSDSSSTITTRVEVSGTHATVAHNGAKSDVDLPEAAFAIAPYSPIAQHLALIRYWRGHGAPSTIAVIPGAPTNAVSIHKAGIDTIGSGASRIILTRYTIDGLVWGLEHLWLDADGRLAAFATAGGGLSFKAIRGDLVPHHDEIMVVASRAAIKDLISISNRTRAIADGRIALVGATLVDATGRPAIPNATVVVNNGRIVAAGPSAGVAVPSDAKRIDVRGKTIIPGLWDMHTHLHQLEWVPVYLAAGMTSVRDMGNELPFVTDLRATIESGRANGPHIYLAGLIDGPGPNAFGALSASTPDEGRAIVRQYHALGFEQMKLYSLLSPAVVGAVCDEAHRLGMTVTGHIPVSLTLLAAVDSGMDQVAHMPIRGDATSDSVRATIAHLKARRTVLDPTESWAEIGGHSTAEPLQSFQPVTQHLPTTFLQFRAASWGSASVDTATAHARLGRSLMMIRALYDAGVPIVAGTDEGVPGFSVYRELELYVRAGMSPMDALRSATAVPAIAMRVDKDVGTIEPGKRADLLVLDANPLENISNVRTVRLVMKGGHLFDSAALWRAVGFTP
jgi:imidazolonepropionase-like amidohydrolase